MSGTDYAARWNDDWSQAHRSGVSFGADSETRAEQLLSLCGGGSVLDVGCGGGGLVLALLRQGVDAHGIDVARRPIRDLNEIAPGRFSVGSILDLPFPNSAFDTLVCTGVLECLDESDVARALAELYRVTRRFAFLTVSTVPGGTGALQRIAQGRSWWEERLFRTGFRKHPRQQTLFPYESFETESTPIVIVLEKIPPAALQRYPLETLQAERDLHMDMLRETGRRSDAHIARYHLACPFVRPGDVVLDVACGLGYGCAILTGCTPAVRLIGMDSSRYAVEYARSNYGAEGVEFHEGDASDLRFLPDSSVDFVVSLETLEHLRDPEAFLAELRRVLRPSGRILVSVPNEWTDETGLDPNPAHLHVYTWPKLRSQLERHFVLEKLYAQTAGGGLKWSDRPRRLREVALGQDAGAEAEWWLALGMKNPAGFDKTGYRETSFPDHSARKDYHITAFGRDYDNPWLVKGMVSIGMRLVNPHALERLARTVFESARPGSADAGAAICVLGYRLLEDPTVNAGRVDQFLESVQAYHACADDTAHAWRWRISNQYLAALLQLATGRLEQAREAFLQCAQMDCLKFGPLLATKTVDAWFRAGLIAACRGNLQEAASDWERALREARRVLTGDWLNIWGQPEQGQVVAFGMPEATQVLDLATRCAYGLVALKHWPSRPGYAWIQAFRNNARELGYWRRLAAERCATIDRLAAAVKDQVQRLSSAAAEIEQLRRDKEEFHRLLENQKAWAAKVEEMHAQQCRQTEELRQRLDAILSSTGWAALQVAYRVRFALMPRGSRRDRLGRWIMQKQRQFRFHARQGLGPLARAIGRAVRRIPGKLRQRICREITRPAALPTTGIQCAGYALEVPGLVSVVLPVYNQADLLRDSIESVLAQTYADFELIIVNDGSTDDVARVLDAYVGHPKVRILTQANQKLPKALSNGFDFARGEFWTWTSADNLMEPRALERQVEFLRANPDAAMVYCDYLAIDDRGEPLRDPSFRPQNRRSPNSPEIHVPRDTRSLNTVQDNFIGACFLYRGWVGRLLGDYAPILGLEDYDYWMRMNALFPMRHLGTDELLYRYRVHDNSLNARASDHQIYERGQRLMWYEQQRGSYFRRAWKVYVDEATRASFQGSSVRQHTLHLLQPAMSLRGEREEVLIVVRPETLAALKEADLPQTRCVAVWFDADPAAPYRYGRLIQRKANLCLAGDAATAARLSLYTRQTFLVNSGQSALDLCVAFANNDVFARKTLPAEDCVRHLPQVYRPADRRLRVLLQANNFARGGLERVMLDIAAVLDPAEFEVSLLILGEQGPLASEAGRLGVPILRLPEGNRSAHYRQLLADERIDLVNAHCSLFGVEIAAELGVPFVQTVHNSYVWFTPEDVAAYQAADVHTSAYLCVSSSVAAYTEQRIGLSADKMLVVPNGIDVCAIDAARDRCDRLAVRASLGFQATDFVFVCPASVTAVKGQLHLVRALAAAIKQNPSIRLALLGHTSDKEYVRLVEAEIDRLGLAAAVKFLGHHEDPYPCLLACDAFIQPSFVEGWSLALAEALYAGLPCVATDVGAAGELLAETGGIVIPPPFRSMLDYDHIQFAVFEKSDLPSFVEKLAAAMVEMAESPEPPELDEALRSAIDRRQAYQAYAYAFKWLALKGSVAAVRPFIWDVHRPRGARRLTSDPLRRSAGRREAGRGAGSSDEFQASEQTVACVCDRARAGRGAVVFLRSIDWSQWLFQRPHHLARCLARQGYTVIYDDNGRFTGFAGFKEIEPNLYLFRGSPDQLYRIPNPVLWSFCYNYHLRDGFGDDAAVIYDLIDDFAVHPYDRQIMERNHQRAIREASVVAYVARHLEGLVKERPDRLYLPNGVEYDRFADETIPMPRDPRMRHILQEGKPVAGYYGALAEWFDYGLLERTARLRPDWNFVLIGVDYDGSLQGRSLFKCPNVHWIGPRDYAALPAYLRAFTVATIPFVINEITLSTSPLKLYEYFAGGKPVITTPMPECMAYPEVNIIRDAGEFSAALDAARAQGQDAAFCARLHDIGRRNSWSARVAAVLDALDARARSR